MRARDNKSGSTIALEWRLCVAWSQPKAAGVRDTRVCNATDIPGTCVDACETQSCVRHAIYCGRVCRCFSLLGSALHSRQGAARDDDAKDDECDA
jgi:hypothetical protein